VPARNRPAAAFNFDPGTACAAAALIAFVCDPWPRVIHDTEFDRFSA
jgi:hypothetical protein